MAQRCDLGMATVMTPPVLPPAALAAQLGGKATVRCTVTAEGSLADCKILYESPSDQGFGHATLTVAQFWKIRPVRLDGTSTKGATFQRTVVWIPPRHTVVWLPPPR